MFSRCSRISDVGIFLLSKRRRCAEKPGDWSNHPNALSRQFPPLDRIWTDSLRWRRMSRRICNGAIQVRDDHVVSEGREKAPRLRVDRDTSQLSPSHTHLDSGSDSFLILEQHLSPVYTGPSHDVRPQSPTRPSKLFYPPLRRSAVEEIVHEYKIASDERREW